MKSKLFFKHIKHNILRYAIGLSAVGHFLGFFIFPTWEPTPDPAKEKIIKIKTIVETPPKKLMEKKLPEPELKVERKIIKPSKKVTPVNRAIKPTPKMQKIAKAARPLHTDKRSPMPVKHSKQTFQPAKAIQHSSPIPHPLASFQKMAESKSSAPPPPSPRQAQPRTTVNNSYKTVQIQNPVGSFLNTGLLNPSGPTRQFIQTSETTFTHPTVQAKQLSDMALINRSQTPRARTFKSQGDIAHLQTASAQRATPTTVKDFNSTNSPASAVKAGTTNKAFSATPVIQARGIQLQKRGTPATPAKKEIFESMVLTPSPTAEIHIQSPKSLDFKIPSSGQRAFAVAGKRPARALSTSSFLQMASIPSGFSEEMVNGAGNTETHNSSGEDDTAVVSDNITGDQTGEIRKAFLSQVWAKIAQTKYYPRIARKRGFEGKPVVAFTIGDNGDLLEVAINSPSSYKLLDNAALDAVKSASPYPPIPELLKKTTLKFKVPIPFSLEDQ